MKSSDTRPKRAVNPDQQESNLQDVSQFSERNRLRRIFRFGLLELLLVTAACAAWIPALLAFRSIPGLREDIQMMQQATLDLVIEDPSQVVVRTLPSVWYQMDVWKYYAPVDCDLELRLGREGINSYALPVDYQAVALPPGEHTIQLKELDDQKGLHAVVYIDGKPVLGDHRSPDWLNSRGSSISSDVPAKAKTFQVSDVVRLCVEKADPAHPFEQYSSVLVHGDHDSKGMALWISPAAIEVLPAPNFIARARRAGEWTIGNRTGIRVRSSNEKDAVGLLDIEPALDATLGDPMLGKETVFGVSVRPVVTPDAIPEIPEWQPQQERSTHASAVMLHAEDETSKAVEVEMTSRLWEKRSISEDGTKMRVFAHFEPFPSGAQPVVEILFDSKHPYRIGFMPRAAAGSRSLSACQFVTRFDSRFLWTNVQLLEDSQPQEQTDSLIRNVPFDSLSPVSHGHGKSFLPTGDGNASSWLSVPFKKLPLSASSSVAYRSRKLSLSTKVRNISKVVSKLAVPTRWQYRGVPNRQVWWLPDEGETEEVQSNATIELLPTSFFPATDVRLPGGDAIGSVRITVPMPATKPVWLALEPDLKLLNEGQ